MEPKESNESTEYIELPGPFGPRRVYRDGRIAEQEPFYRTCEHCGQDRAIGMEWVIRSSFLDPNIHDITFPALFDLARKGLEADQVEG